MIDRCGNGWPPNERYCPEPSYGDPAYTGICPGCGGYEECFCIDCSLPIGSYGRGED